MSKAGKRLLKAATEMRSMVSDIDTHQGPAYQRNPKYRQQIIKFAGTLIYLRIDLGPDLESVQLCFDDGEPDTFDMGKLPGLKMARLFIELMEHAGHWPSEQLNLEWPS